MAPEEWEHKTVSEGYLWTRVFHKDSGVSFWVTTINRNSSCRETPDHIYSESFVWDCDEKGLRGRKILFEDSDSRNSPRTHFKLVKKLLEGGLDALEEEEK